MRKIIIFLAASVTILLSTNLLAATKKTADFVSKQYTIHSYKQFYTKLQAIQRKYHLPAQQILLVFDLDNTLLRMHQYLGSPEWFAWQENLLQQKPLPKQAIAPSFPQLLDDNRLILSATRTAFVEPKVEPLYLQHLLKKYHAMVLTERSCDLLSLSEVEFSRHNLNFLSTAVGPKGGYAMPINDLTAKLAGYKRPICYQQGIMLAAGQNKAQVLRDYLHYIRQSHPPRYIFFIDDTLKNVKEMQVAFPKDLIAFHYLGNQKRVQAFNNPRAKALVSQQWQRYYQALKVTFGIS